ncbi:MAG TPA: LLM class flavin-dependent oxidoreductase [Xanthobacteraceae bacterium]|nr:LLM class flavin-dependent oxidoreductase [Xanthobacteraceae bacterium]
MARPKGELKLGAFFNPTGHHVASWRHPRAQADAGINFAHYVEITRTAERGKFDMVFLADNVGVREAHMDALCRSAQYIANFEPITLIAALAAVTERIGLVCTATTSYNEPFHIARKFASLDHISGGRVGWNLVTSGMAMEAYNFGRDAHYGHAERYDRAREFAEVVVALWDSWDDDAFVRDKASGLFFDPAKLHRLNHVGKHFKVRGPLNIPRPPQGHPVIVQAGTSEDGMDVAARFAEVIFSANLTIESCQEYFREIKRRAAQKFGRNPDHLKVMPGLSCYVGRTPAEAEEKYQYQNSLMHPIVAREILSTVLGGIDLSPYDFDGPLPENLPMTQGSQSHFKYVTELARTKNLSMRQIAEVVAGARGKLVIKGTPQEIADFMEHWYCAEAADGFNIMPPTLPGGLDDFVAMVIPELQRRGLFRTEYTGRTLREHLGLPRPPSRYARATEAAE